ncbi:MAG TPA: aminotransferase class V-fold PLP-dependent enzyme [Thermoanaerobaculia bacterium]|nr:aminotransferase class V-fold PLP-dependent enzyme [Thermoanaerobaculia bacterium]
MTASLMTVSDVSDEQVAAWRRDTPGCATRNHLNNAGSALTPRPVADAVKGYLDRELEIGGYEAADEAAGRIEEVYGHLGRLLGCAPRNVAVVENATVGFSQALSAFDFERGDVLVTTRADYVSNQIMYQALNRRRGVEVLHADDLPEGGVDPGSLARLAAHPRCRLVAVTWVPTNSGLVQDVEAVGEVCAARGVPYLVDACQAVGQIAVDVRRLRCDFLAGTARKFLRGPRGIGFLYASDAILGRGAYPLGVDMRGADRVGDEDFKLVDGARRFENWEFSYALVLGLGEAARYALDVGIEESGGRAIALAGHVRERLGALPGVRLADRGRRLCAIATAEVEGWDAAAVVHRLRAAGINTSVSSSEDGAPVPVVRISPHYYNTREEVAELVNAIEGLLREEKP